MHALSALYPLSIPLHCLFLLLQPLQVGQCWLIQRYRLTYLIVQIILIRGKKNHIWLHGLQTFENMIFIAYIYSCVCWCNTSYSRNSISFCLVSVAENCKHKFKSLQIELRIFKKPYSLDMALRSQITQDWQRIIVYMMRAEITIRVITIRMHLYTSPAVFFIVID